MNKLFKIVAVLILCAFGGFSLSAFAAEILSKEERDILNESMALSREDDPATYAVMMDHMEETEVIFRELFDTRDQVTARRKLVALGEKYVLPTMARASDEATVALYKPMKAYIEVVKDHKPGVCKLMLAGQFTNNIRESPAITAAYKPYSDAMLEVYSSGKKNTHTGKLLTVEDMVQIFSDDLKFSGEDMETVFDPSGVSDAEACRLAVLFYDLERISVLDRAAYLRTLLFAR
jgi:hypothetical protein